MTWSDMPLAAMKVIYRIFALLVVDHKLVDPALLRLYSVKPLIIAVQTQV